mmetsp:Transcript_24374/g.31823  ORF Transcript_24374/g.31823 Transcript_24374/m.31823 type:complete len:547 (+) Transcript_24374:210-1850(+)
MSRKSFRGGGFRKSRSRGSFKNSVLPYSLEDVQQAMEDGEEPDDVDLFKGKSYLHQCAYFGELEAVEYLITQHGADITCRTAAEGHSILRIAVDQKRDNVAAYIVDECLRRDPTGGLLKVLLYNAEAPSTLQMVFSNGLLQTIASLSPYRWAALRRQQSRLPLPVDNHQPADHLSAAAKDIMDRYELPWEGRASVHLIHKRHIVKARRLLSFEECKAMQLHIKADVIGASEKVLFVSRFWNGEEVDPYTMNYNTIKLFLEDNPHIAYVWVDVMCMPCNEREQVSRDLNQLILASFLSSEMLVIPDLDEEGDSDLLSYRNSGWCQAEMTMCLMRGCPIHLTFTAQFSETKFVTIPTPAEDMYQSAGNDALEQFEAEAETGDDREIVDRLSEKWIYAVTATPTSPRASPRPPGSPRSGRRAPRLKPAPTEISNLISCVVESVVSLDKALIQKICTLQLTREDVMGNWIANMVVRGHLLEIYDTLGEGRFQNDKADIVLVLLYTFSYHMGYFEVLSDDQKDDSGPDCYSQGLLSMEEELQRKLQPAAEL